GLNALKKVFQGIHEAIKLINNHVQ
uniref:Pseudin-2 n=1 Tax=Pseudis paradoxa TaxID=43558 RepID=PS2_PSEPD|nr:RecName: Full=Pseudin-2 [Pseudis paradoxa]2NCX_A Chain A, Pseudin-2 [Pseudis paradoxa]